MKERPILFSAPMVRAILDGRKTQTRRVVKPCKDKNMGVPLAACELAGEVNSCDYTNSPYGQPGDRIVVKEAAWMWCERVPNGKTATGRDKWLYRPLRSAPVHYVADHPERPALDVVSPDTGNQWGWRYKAARFLPKWARRITLEIVSVRVERLQDISEADAIAEGVQDERTMILGPRGEEIVGPIAEYAVLWESINGPGSWDANPWVWVIEFKRVKP